MKFDYLVKHNGVYYQAGEEVPVDGKAVATEKKVEKTEKPLEKVEVEEPKFDVSAIEDKVAEPIEAVTYSKTDIMKMPKATLIELMEKNGLHHDDDTTNADMKKALVAYYGL